MPWDPKRIGYVWFLCLVGVRRRASIILAEMLDEFRILNQDYSTRALCSRILIVHADKGFRKDDTVPPGGDEVVRSLSISNIEAASCVLGILRQSDRIIPLMQGLTSRLHEPAGSFPTSVESLR